MNRDYFSRPTQAHGRSAPDYGNTRLDRKRSADLRLWVAAAGFALVGLVAAGWVL